MKKRLVSLILIIFISLLNFHIYTSLNSQYHSIKSYASKITLKFKGSSTFQIYYNAFTPVPIKIYINNVQQSEIKNEYSINYGYPVKLEWSSNLNSCNSLFNGCSGITEIDFSEFSTSGITDMENMFQGCTSLKSLDLSGFDTRKVTNMNYMFDHCTSLTTVNIENFNTRNVEHMSGMFCLCSKLESLTVSHFDTTKVSEMQYMFSGCSSLKSLDISNFRTSKVERMHEMFNDCSSLTSLYLKNFNTAKVTMMSKMFSGCTSLTSLDLSNFDTSKITLQDNISEMFARSSSLVFINLQNALLLYSNIKGNLFDGTPNNLIIQSNYDKWKSELNGYQLNINCQSKSYKCFQKRQSVTYNKYICDICGENYYRIYADDSNSNTNLNCYQLIDNYYVDTDTNFYKPCYTTCQKCTEAGTSNEHNCNECKNQYKYRVNKSGYFNCLERCDYYEYSLSNSIYCTESFNCPNGYKLIEDKKECIDDCSKDSEYKFELDNKCVKTLCHPDCRECQGRSTDESTNCISCASGDKYLYLGDCVQECKNYSFYDEENNQAVCKCELEQCKICNIESLTQNLCTKCEEGFYPIFNPQISNNYSNCSKEPEGYYLDEQDKIYKPCYITCKTCCLKEDTNKHNCLKCKDEYKYGQLLGDFLNCYSECLFYTYYDENRQSLLCTNDYICPVDYNKLINEEKKCISNCTKEPNHKYEYQAECYEYCPPNTKERDNIITLGEHTYDKYFCQPICTIETPFEIIVSQICLRSCKIKDISENLCLLDYTIFKKNNETKTEEEIVKEAKIKANDFMRETIEKEFTSLNYNITNLNSGNNDIIHYDKMMITLTNIYNQKSINNSNTYIDLKECEDILKHTYNILKNESIYIKKTDVEIEGMKIPKIEYDVYAEFNKSLNKLNISVCKGIKIDLYISLKLDEDIDIDILNSSSGYYNDLCYPATSESNTDIILKDRRNEFINKNRTVCQEECIFTEYNKETEKVKCSCEVQESSFSFSDIKIDKNKLYDNFIKVENIANIKLLLCYKILFFKGLVKNIGSYILGSIILTHIIFIILFYAKNMFSILLEKIEYITYGLKKWKLLSKEKAETRINQTSKKNINEESRKKLKLNNKKLIKNNHRKNNNNKNRNNTLNLNKIYTYNNKQNNLKGQNLGKNHKINHKLLSKHKSKNKIKRIHKIMEYNEEELNDLSYELALKYDHRTYCQFYASLLKSKHLILFTFINNTDYNIKLLKIDLLLFGFCSQYCINSLFFNDDTMHKIYQDEGSFNIEYQLPKIIYSSLISAIFDILIQKLALSEDAILDYKKITKNKKKSKNKNDGFFNFNDEEKRLNKKLKIKFVLYFILSGISLFFFWYYLAMFCAVYKNTQFQVIEDTLMSYGLSLLYPFGIYLLPGIFRIPSLSNSKYKKKCLYKFSKLLQML